MIKKAQIALYVERFLNSRTDSTIRCVYETGKDTYSIRTGNRSLEFRSFGIQEKSKEELLEEFDTQTYLFDNDFMETIFFFLSGYWEYKNPDNVDTLGRYVGVKSFGYTKKCLRIPVVDILVKRIYVQLGAIEKEFYNSPKFCITHDIDFLKVPQMRLILRDLLKRRDWHQGFKRIKNCILRHNPYDLERFLDKELALGLKPICFMLNTIQDKETAGGYKLAHHKKEQAVVREKSKQGVEFGLHYSTDYNKTRYPGNYSEIERLTGRNADFGRAHYLIFNLLESYKILCENKITMDFTAGYRDCIGFRFGTSMPFQPFDFENNRAYDIWAIPLVIMDGTWISIETELDEDEKKKEALNQIIRQIETSNGMLTLLWHNTSQVFDSWSKYENWYWELVDLVKNKDFQMVNVENFVNL